MLLRVCSMLNGFGYNRNLMLAYLSLDFLARIRLMINKGVRHSAKNTASSYEN
jgi:hypothetical protein